MVTPVLVFDATHDNIGALPEGAQVAGYTTGTGTHIRWTDADFAAHPGAVRIDQDPAASDPTPTSWTSRREPLPRPARPAG